MQTNYLLLIDLSCHISNYLPQNYIVLAFKKRYLALFLLFILQNA